MSRVPYPDCSAEQVALEAQVREARHGQFPNLYRLMSHVPVIASSWLRLGSAIRYQSALRGDLRELAICAVAARTSSEYEWHHHAPLAEAEGVERSQLRSLWEKGRMDGASREQDVCVRYASSVALGSVTDESIREVLSVFDVEGLVELTAIASYYTGVSRFLLALDIEVEEKP
jgi:alkylhydroperoxidase family enzyme